MFSSVQSLGNTSSLTVQRSAVVQRTSLVVLANKKVQKKTQVVLLKDIQGVGKTGAILRANVGYVRNYLLPNRLASPVTEGILANIERVKKEEVDRRAKVKATAQQMATALQTIGKFVIKKKVGEENRIFGSVTTADVVDAIRMQTGRELDKSAVTLPDIKTTGTYEANVKLHPEVIANFIVVVSKDTGAK